MIRPDRYVYEPEIIAAILDLCETVTVGFQDKHCPYLVPLNYGYKVTEDHLQIFIHSPKEGYKLRLIDANPLVCLSFHVWQNFPDREYKGHWHDFRSVTAFGKVRLLDLKEDADLAREGLQALFKKNMREGCKNPKGMKAVNVYVIECAWEDVSGKTETPVRTPADVPMVDVYNVPQDLDPYDISDLKASRPNKIRNRRYLGYLREDE